MVLAITIVVTLGGGVSSEGSVELDAAGSELGSSCDVEFPNCLLTYLGK